MNKKGKFPLRSAAALLAALLTVTLALGGCGFIEITYDHGSDTGTGEDSGTAATDAPWTVPAPTTTAIPPDKVSYPDRRAEAEAKLEALPDVELSVSDLIIANATSTAALIEPEEGDLLKMEYECAMAQSHPHKLYFVLRNICHVGDRYDDEFCSKFGARRTYEPRITPYSDAETDRVCEAVRQVCRETLDALAEYAAERRYGYAWNVLDTALYKIAYFAHPQGQLMNELEKAVDDMDKELPVAELVAKGKTFLEKLLAASREELARDLYFVDTLISTKRRSSLNNVQENMKDVYTEATEAIQAENYERSAVRILYKFYEMYFYNDVQDDLNALVSRALERSAGKPMEEASEILYDALDNIMEGELDAEDDDDAMTGLADAMTGAMAGAAEQMQRMASAMESQIADMQTKMQEAMMRGDMAEYMRLATEFQQKMLEQAMGKQE